MTGVKKEYSEWSDNYVDEEKKEGETKEAGEEGSREEKEGYGRVNSRGQETRGKIGAKGREKMRWKEMTQRELVKEDREKKMKGTGGPIKGDKTREGK